MFPNGGTEGYIKGGVETDARVRVVFRNSGGHEDFVRVCKEPEVGVVGTQCRKMINKQNQRRHLHQRARNDSPAAVKKITCQVCASGCELAGRGGGDGGAEEWVKE